MGILGFFESLNNSMLNSNDEKISKFVNQYNYESFSRLVNIAEDSDSYNAFQRQAAKYILATKYSDSNSFEEISYMVYSNATSCKKFRLERPKYVPKISYYPYQDDLDYSYDENIQKGNDLWKMNKPAAAVVLYNKAISNCLTKTNDYNRDDYIETMRVATKNLFRLCENWVYFDSSKKEECYQLTISTYEKAIEYFEKYPTYAYTTYLYSSELAEFYIKKMSNEDSAKIYLEKALFWLQDYIDGVDTIDANNYANKGYLLYKLDRLDEAINEYELALQFASDIETQKVCEEWVRNLRQKI